MVKQIYFKHRNAASAIFNNALVENYKENFDARRISVEKKDVTILSKLQDGSFTENIPTGVFRVQ